MALQNHPNLYTGGSEVFDSSPTVDTFARLQQRRQAEETAKNEALNKYFSELPKRVNTAGILDTHLFDDKEGEFPGLNTRINQLMEYGKQNMKEIGKGGEAKLAYDQMVNGVVMDIERAKQASKDTLEAAKMKIEGKIGMDDEDLTVFDKMTKSIYDKDAYKPDGVSRYGFMDFSANLPQFDPNKGFESWTKGLEGEKVFDESKKISDPQAGVVRVPYTIKLSPEQVKTAAIRAKGEYNADRVARSYWKKQFENVKEDELKDLEKYFKKYVGGGQVKTPDGKVLDLSQIDTAEEYAMASAAKQAESLVKKSDYDTRLDKELATQRARVNISLSQRPSGGGGVQIITGNEFDRIPIPKKKWFNSGNRVNPEEIPSSTKAILKTAGIDVEGMEYFEIVVDGDKIQAITPYWKDKDGKLHKEGVITRQDMENAQLKYNTEAQKGQQPVFGGGQQNERLPKQIDKTRMNNRRKYKGLDKNGNPIFE